MMKNKEIKMCENCIEDSIAHKIKQYFVRDTICSNMLFEFDEKKKKLLVSKTIIKYLLTLCNDGELLVDYDMEMVDETKIHRNRRILNDFKSND